MSLSEMINRAGEKAYQKKFESTELEKYNRMIADEEYNINMCYAHVGKAYLDSVENVPEEYAPFLESIKKSMEKTEEYKKQIRELKGLVLCEKCNSEVSLESPFCPSCGNKMPERQILAPDTVMCVGCSTIINVTMRFCPVCAMPVAQSMNFVPANAQPQQIVNPPKQDATLCPNCHNAIQAGSKFCVVCGTPVQGETTGSIASNVCPGCGKAFEQGTKFCVDCGTKIG